MKPSFPKRDWFHLEAAQGWLELGNYFEANAELEKLSPALRIHPHVLECRCRLYEAAEKWEMSLEIAKTLCDQLPGRLSGWLHQARCLHHLGKTDEAYHLLVNAVDHFPGNAAIRYDIAAYAAQHGLLEEAVGWLKLCFEFDPERTYRLEVLDDPAFERIWEEISKLG